ncbi:hypothetical protein [Mesorhizobium sp.]|uniref:hypothetical protein n=1 Tax=Mesorhizobium sp. TaxID=1871066 RepID=UPI000FE8CE81|nr:hypothetical protein [Mesorhizobium sp.]RWP11014.1 MAG: hypothetical protein EOQ97_11285 [Mesorhizobium sp.]
MTTVGRQAWPSHQGELHGNQSSILIQRVLRGFHIDGTWLILSLFVAGGLILGFGLLAEEVIEGDTSGFDRAVLLAFRSPGDPTNPIGIPWLEEMGRDVTSLGSFAFLAFVSVTAVGYLLIKRERWYASLVALAVVGGEVISTLLKIAFDRPVAMLLRTGASFDFY